MKLAYGLQSIVGKNHRLNDITAVVIEVEDFADEG